MSDNIFLGPDAQVRFSLQRLRAHEGRGRIADERVNLIDGVFLSNDPEAKVTGEYDANAANMVKLRMRPGAGTARWQGMHIAMGAMDIGDAAVIGVVTRSQAPSSFTTQICLRSGQDGHFVDTFFPKTMVSFAQPSTHLDILEISRLPDLPRQAQWRELILFFQGHDVDLDLLDLRFFIV